MAKLFRYEYFDRKTDRWLPSYSIEDDKEMKRMNVIVGWKMYRKAGEE